MLVFVLLAPVTSATGVLTAGPVVVVLDNGQSECLDPGSDLCLVGGSRSEPIGADETIDTNQRIRYLAIAVDRSFINNALGYPLLPDGSLSVVPSDLEVENPMFRLLISHVGERHAPAPMGDFSVAFDEFGYGFFYRGPGLDPLDPEPGRHGVWSGYSNESGEEGPVERDRIRPQADFNSTSTDRRVRDVPNDSICQSDLRDIDCGGKVGSAADVYENKTSNVVVGLAFEEAQLATDPAHLEYPDHQRAPKAQGPVTARRSGLVENATAGRLVNGPGEALGSIRHESFASLPSVSPLPPFRPNDLPMIHGPPEALPPADMPALLAASVAFAIAVALSLLYSKVLKDKGSLLTIRRSEILAVLSKDGPVSVGEIAEQIGVDRSTVKYHAHVLLRAGCVRLHRRGRNTLLALPDTSAEMISGRDAAAKLVCIIRGRGGCVERMDLTSLVPGMPMRTQNYALRQLQDRGIIVCEAQPGRGSIRLRLMTG